MLCIHCRCGSWELDALQDILGGQLLARPLAVTLVEKGRRDSQSGSLLALDADSLAQRVLLGDYGWLREVL